MGRIGQLSDDIYLPSIEKRTLVITNWKILRVCEDYDGVDITVRNSTYLVKGITLKDAIRLSNENKKEHYEFRYSTEGLICNKCMARGYLDWIDRATTGKNNIVTIDFFRNSSNYKRNKKGPVTKIKTKYGDTLYISTPAAKKGTEFCPACYGCGVKQSDHPTKIEKCYFV